MELVDGYYDEIKTNSLVSNKEWKDLTPSERNQLRYFDICESNYDEFKLAKSIGNGFKFNYG